MVPGAHTHSPRTAHRHTVAKAHSHSSRPTQSVCPTLPPPPPLPWPLLLPFLPPRPYPRRPLAAAGPCHCCRSSLGVTARHKPALQLLQAPTPSPLHPPRSARHASARIGAGSWRAACAARPLFAAAAALLGPESEGQQGASVRPLASPGKPSEQSSKSVEMVGGNPGPQPCIKAGRQAHHCGAASSPSLLLFLLLGRSSATLCIPFCFGSTRSHTGRELNYTFTTSQLHGSPPSSPCSALLPASPAPRPLHALGAPPQRAQRPCAPQHIPGICGDTYEKPTYYCTVG